MERSFPLDLTKYGEREPARAVVRGAGAEAVEVDRAARPVSVSRRVTSERGFGEGEDDLIEVVGC